MNESDSDTPDQNQPKDSNIKSFLQIPLIEIRKRSRSIKETLSNKDKNDTRNRSVDLPRRLSLSRRSSLLTRYGRKRSVDLQKPVYRSYRGSKSEKCTSKDKVSQMNFINKRSKTEKIVNDKPNDLSNLPNETDPTESYFSVSKASFLKFFRDGMASSKKKYTKRHNSQRNINLKVNKDSYLNVSTGCSNLEAMSNISRSYTDLHLQASNSHFLAIQSSLSFNDPGKESECSESNEEDFMSPVKFLASTYKIASKEYKVSILNKEALLIKNYIEFFFGV